MEQRRAPDRMCTRHQLEDALRKLGVSQGMTLSVHASLSSLGFLPGGAQSVVDALLAVLGPQGTLVMPAHCGDNSDPSYWRNPPVPESWWPAIREAMPAFDPARTPARKMGAVADCFRAYPGVIRSNHPTSSFIARGPAAADLLARHDLGSPLGDASPAGALARADAWILLLGVSYDCCTEMHLAEYRSGCRTTFRQGSAVLRDGQRVYVYYNEIELNSDEFLEPGRLLEAAGLVRLGEVSSACLRLFRVRDAVRVTENWLGQNRMRRQGEADRARILDYLEAELEYNLFLIGDIEGFGMSTDFQDVMAFEQDGAIDSILLRYHHSYIPYSRKLDFAVEPLLSALNTPNLRILSGKGELMDRLQPHLTDFHWRESHLMRLQPQDRVIDAGLWPEPAGMALRKALPQDVPDLADFLAGIAEFETQGSREERLQMLEKAISSGSSRYYLYRHAGQVVASAGTAAENSRSAMVVAVATAPAWRGQGLASRLLCRLTGDVLASGRFLCLFYDNPDAGRIYRRLGFQDVGRWIMATAPDPLPGKR